MIPSGSFWIAMPVGTRSDGTDSTRRLGFIRWFENDKRDLAFRLLLVVGVVGVASGHDRPESLPFPRRRNTSDHLPVEVVLHADDDRRVFSEVEEPGRMAVLSAL